MSASNALIHATTEHLGRFAPFDQMEPAHLTWMAERLSLGYYAQGHTLLEPGQGEAQIFYIIKQGVVHGEQDIAQAQEDSAWLELHDGECFPLGALLSKRGVTSTYRAGVDTFCYELSAKDFNALLKLSPAFNDFCTRRIANLLEKSKQVIQAQYAQSSSNQIVMSSPLARIIRRAPQTCSPDAPLRDVLERMHTLAIGSMIAVDASNKPVGIFTLRDLLSRVVLAERGLDTPLKEVMTSSPFSMSPQAFGYEAALAMAKYGFRHILVEDKGQLMGLISEKDLFSLQRIGLRQISSAIRKAEHLETLKGAAQDIRQLAHNMLAQGIAAEQLTQIISTLNDLLTSRIIELELRDSPAQDIEFCWLALGSEGRFEQTLNTDQDNGIIFSVSPGQDPAALQAILLPFAKRVNLALAECGFPLCKGEVMACNPRWCLSLEGWQKAFDDWIYHGAPMDLLHATIFFDFRPLYGASQLALELRAWLKSAAQSNSRFLHQMAVNALRNRPPLGMVRDFVTGEGNMLDLKLNGVTPFVDAARIYSLAQGVTATNTLQRLSDIAAPLNIKPQDAQAYGDAFQFIQLLRLRLHHDQCQRSAELSNMVNPDDLNNLDRRILKEAFRQGRKLQTKLALDYQI